MKHKDKVSWMLVFILFAFALGLAILRSSKSMYDIHTFPSNLVRYTIRPRQIEDIRSRFWGDVDGELKKQIAVGVIENWIVYGDIWYKTSLYGESRLEIWESVV